MSDQVGHAHQVIVVLDPEFGDRLMRLSPEQPIWIAASAANRAAVDAMAQTVGPQPDITTMTHHDGEADKRFLSYLDMIDLHHGPMSSAIPYTAMNVIGASLTPAIRDALTKLGFSIFTENVEGFIATRTVEEATRLRL